MTELFTVGKTAPITGLSTTSHGGPIISMPNKCMTYNLQTGEPLGVVGTDYNIMQPQECYDLVEKTCGNVENVRWDGRTMVMQGKINSMLLPGDDQVDNMFTIINSFDGTSALHGLGISFRMTCMNQLNMAFKMAHRSGLKLSIRHSGDWENKVNNFERTLDRVKEGRFEFNRNVATLVERKVDSDDIDKLWKSVGSRVLGLTKADFIEEKMESTALKINGYVSALTEIYESERAQGLPDSLWLAANAVTKHVQHKVAKRGRKADADRRFVDNAVGIRASVSSYVMSEALQMA